MLNNLKNINLLRTFECSARHQSYSKAADELFISQAAVSQQMRLLEADLGRQLFLRKGRLMRLTRHGQTLFQATQQALAILENSVNELVNEELAGDLIITSTQAFTSLWLMPRLSLFTSRYPEINIQINSSPQFEDLQQRHIDLAIRFSAKELDDALGKYKYEYFGEEAVWPVCSVQLADKLSLNSPTELLKTWLVTLEEPGVFSWPKWFDSNGTNGYQQHQKWTYVQSTDMAIHAVLNGHGCTLAAEYLCGHYITSGQLKVPVSIPHPQSLKRYFVYEPSSSKIRRIKLFMNWLKQQMNAGP